jgi:hypothetical protein
MRDIQDLHDAVDQRKTHGDDEQPRRVNQTVDDDGNQLVHGIT